MLIGTKLLVISNTLVGAVLLALFLITLSKKGRGFYIRHKKKLFVGAIAVVFVSCCVFAFVQYKTWESDDLAKFFLPRYQGYSYTVFYLLVKFFAPHLISLILALAMFYVLPAVNKRYGGYFFESEEPYLAATAIFLVSHPGWFIYLVLLLLIYLVWHLFSWLRGRKGVRLPLYNLWFAVGLLVFIVDSCWLINTPLWKLLKI